MTENYAMRWRRLFALLWDDRITYDEFWACLALPTNRRPDNG